MFTEKAQNKLRSDIIILIVLFLAALIVRLIALDRIYIIARDGFVYVSLSQVYLSGLFLEGLSHPYHPLYPVMMAMVGNVIGDSELAGKIISLVASSLTVIPLYLLGRSLYDAKVGITGGLFFVFQPYCVRFSVDVLSDPIFLFFFVLAFYLGLQAIREEKNASWWSLGAGASSGLAYLTRPEGILVAVFLVGWYFSGWIFGQKKRATSTLSVMAALLLAFFVFAGPYIVFIKMHTGSWQISMKPSVSKAIKGLAPSEKVETMANSSSPVYQDKDKDKEGLFRAPAKPKESFQPALWRSVTYTFLKFVETCHYLLFLFLVIGIWSYDKKKDCNLRGTLLGILLVYLLCLCYLYHTVSYVSRRHFVPLISIGLPVAGVGFWVVQKRFSAFTGRFNNKWGRYLTNYSAVIILFLTIVILLPKALKPQRLDKLPLKAAALLIHKKSRNPHPVVMSNEPLVAYYAGGKHLNIPGITYNEFIAFLRRQKVDYVVFGERDIKRGAQFLTRLQPDHLRLIPFETSNVLIYEVIR